jgi:SAM-dependent methyltransferase
VSVYQGEYARLYDLFYCDKPYDGEAAYVDGILRADADGPSERLLDVACGTGQHAARLADRGWYVLGVDQSDDMLALAREPATGRDAAFVRADMRDLQLAESGFDAAVCLFDSIGYAVTNDAIGATLGGIRRHLRPGGLLVLEFWHAAAMLSGFDPVRIREWDTPAGRVLRVSRTTLDVDAETARVAYSVYRLGPDARYESWEEQHENRFFLVQEMDLLLRIAGFTPLRFTAGFTTNDRIDETTWHILGVARIGGSAS